MPITVMGLAIRQHVKAHYEGRTRRIALTGATIATVAGALVFIGQIVGKWSEGGWVVLISFSILALAAHFILISPAGYREPEQIHRIVREKARAEGSMATIVEWQSLKMQEYRYSLLVGISRFFALFGVYRPMQFEPVPVSAGEYDANVHTEDPDAPSLLEPYLHPKQEKLAQGGQTPPDTGVTTTQPTDQPDSGAANADGSGANLASSADRAEAP
jgi:hypothetical protein